MSSTNSNNPDRVRVQRADSVRDSKTAISREGESGTSSTAAANISAGTTYNGDNPERRPFSLIAKSVALTQRADSTCGGNTESRRAWPTPNSVSRGDRPASTVGDVTDAGCASPPGHLHANKWAQIIIRARQRQVLGECENLSPPCGAAEDIGQARDIVADPAAVSDGRSTPSKLVEMWFSKKRVPKADTDDEATDTDTGYVAKIEPEAKDSHRDKSFPRPRLFGKAFGGRDKKQMSLGKVLAKKEEKETEEDLAFKRQCQLELEKRLNECGFGIHAHVKERQTRERKSREPSRSKSRASDAASQTEMERDPAEAHDVSTSENSDVYRSAGLDAASGSCDAEIASVHTERDIYEDSRSSKTRSLPEELTRRVKPNYSSSFHPDSVDSLQSHSEKLESPKPTRRSRSFLDSFRNLASKSLWKKSQQHLHSSKQNTSLSTSDLASTEISSNPDGTAGKDSDLKSACPQLESEESKARVLKQNSIDRGNVLRSVVFYQNRFMVMDQSKPHRNAMGSLEKKDKDDANAGDTERSSRKNDGKVCALNVSKDNSVAREAEDGSNSKPHNGDQTLQFAECNEPALSTNCTRNSKSYNGANNGDNDKHQQRLSVPGSTATQCLSNVDLSVTNCLKSESDLELDAYYNRVQTVSLMEGATQSHRSGTQPENQLDQPDRGSTGHCSSNGGEGLGENIIDSPRQSSPRYYREKSGPIEGVDSRVTSQQNESERTHQRSTGNLNISDLGPIKGRRRHRSHSVDPSKAERSPREDVYDDENAPDTRLSNRISPRDHTERRKEIHDSRETRIYNKKSCDRYSKRDHEDIIKGEVQCRLDVKSSPEAQSQFRSDWDEEYERDREQRHRKSCERITKSLDRLAIRGVESTRKHRSRFISETVSDTKDSHYESVYGRERLDRNQVTGQRDNQDGDDNSLKSQTKMGVPKNSPQHDNSLGNSGQYRYDENISTDRYYPWHHFDNSPRNSRTNELYPGRRGERLQEEMQDRIRGDFDSEDFLLEPMCDSGRYSKNVQFQTDGQIDSGVRYRDSSTGRVRSHHSIDPYRESEYDPTARYKSRRSQEPSRPKNIYQTGSTEHKGSPQRAADRNSKHTRRHAPRSLLESPPEDMEDEDLSERRPSPQTFTPSYRDRGGSRSHSQDILLEAPRSRSRQTDRTPSCDEHCPRESDSSFTASLGDRTPTQLSASHYRGGFKTPGGSNRRGVQSGHREYQVSQQGSHSRHKEYQPIQKDYQYSNEDFQPCYDDFPSSHEEYQPSIRDYQPSRKDYHPSRKDNQPNFSHRGPEYPRRRKQSEQS